MKRSGRYLKLASCMVVCGMTASCDPGKGSGHGGESWLRGPGCSAILESWNEGEVIFDGNIPILDLHVRNGSLGIDESSRVDGADWRGSLQAAKAFNPKPLLRLTILDRTHCPEVSTAMKEATRIYECAKERCMVVQGKPAEGG